MLNLALFILLCLFVAFAATWVGGHRAAAAFGIEPTLRDKRQATAVTKRAVTAARERRCRPALGYTGSPWRARASIVDRRLRHWLRVLAYERRRDGICNREARVIELVFANGTAYMAKTVAYCESKLWRWAHNPSGASGLFQLMPFHWAGRFNPYHTLRNAEYSWRLSNHGYDWGAWVCDPY